MSVGDGVVPNPCACVYHSTFASDGFNINGLSLDFLNEFYVERAID